MTEHQLLLLLAEIVVLVVAARLGGGIAARLGIPLVVGELMFGIALGPSLLGALWPEGFEALFPAEQRPLLDVLGWIGVIFLVLVAGMETRLGLLRRARKAVFTSWVGGFFLPFALGMGFAALVPGELIGPAVDRPVFALFMGTAMAISAIPVIARILMDLNLFRSRVGMVVISTAVTDDTLGWIVLAFVSGLADGGGADAGVMLRTAALTLGFVAVALTLGRPVVTAALKASARLRVPHAQASVMLLLVFLGGLITQAIGVHLVLGAFVFGILIGRVKPLDQTAVESVHSVGMGFFAPLFFAYTGIKVDLTALTGNLVWVAIAAVAVASFGKLVGGGLGARIGGLPKWEAAAVGAGLNARGAMELVIAAIGLSIGVLTEASYAIVVLIAVTTSAMAGPLIRSFMRRAQVSASQSAEVEAEVLAG
jgi:Kef-type K+ transport system membrane component KefB